MAITLQPADSAAATILPQAQLDALLHGAGFAPLDSTAWISVTGSDRVRWLNGMVTNAIQPLASGEGCYNFVLNAQGRIQGDLTAFNDTETLVLKTDRSQIPSLLAHFDHYIIMDDVELIDGTDQCAGLGITGPRALEIIENIGLPDPPMSPLHKAPVTWHDSFVVLLREHSPLVPRIELWSNRDAIQKLSVALIAAGATPVFPESLEALRILEGTPRYGVDIRNTEKSHDLPQETAQTRALHFSKGCYLGQEIVERIRSRGNVHRTFGGFLLTGALPEPGAALTAESFPRPVGELTSVASIPLATRPVQLALGYIRREALDRKLTLEYPGGTATPIALPYSLP